MQFLSLSSIFFGLSYLLPFWNVISAFPSPWWHYTIVPKYPAAHSKYFNSRNDNDDEMNTTSQSDIEEDVMSLDVFRLNQRISTMKAKWNAKVNLLPPNNPFLDPEEFVTTILQQIQKPDSSLPLLGYHVLFHSSSSKWQQVLIQSVAAPILNEKLNKRLLTDENWYAHLQDNDEMVIFLHALQSAMSRSNNQFQILTMEKSYRLYFPGDVVDYCDGKCWLEAQLRDVKTDELMVIMGWSLIRMDHDVNHDQENRMDEEGSPMLVQTESVSSWLIDWLDWQDFRDEFRPGIGREEWERICG
jgi:hypothetical protein